MFEILGLLAMIAVPVAMIWLIRALFVLVGEMARARGHNPWPWWLLSLAWSPLGAIVVLWLFFPVQHPPWKG